MTFIRTINKDISPDDLGVTYSHEHLVCSPPYWVEKSADDLLLDDWIKTKADVIDFKKLGGNTIVDATAIDYGRNILQVGEISKLTDINIIATAGFNKSFLWSAKIPSLLKNTLGNYRTFEDWIKLSNHSALVDFLIEEIEVGLEGTHYKAGQLKFGTGYNSINYLEEKTIKAVAEAHKETGAPIHAHTEAGTMALEQIELLEKYGVSVEFLSIGHMDRNLDPYIHEQVAKKGAFLCFDGISKMKYAPESDRINAILNLVELGFQDQILISGDTARKSYYKHYDSGLGLSYILDKWVERFSYEAEKRGYDSEVLFNKFFVENPSRCFAFKR